MSVNKRKIKSSVSIYRALRRHGQLIHVRSIDLDHKIHVYSTDSRYMTHGIELLATSDGEES